MAYLKLLGGAAMEGDGRAPPPVLAHRHAMALLALLACAPDRELTRGKLVGLLWPDSPEKTARNRLNTYVHRIRSELGEDALLSVGDALRLNRDVLDCDVCRFEEALTAGSLDAAVALYHGALLDGFRLGGSPPFEQWMDREVDRHARSYREALERLAREAESDGRHNASAGRWQELAWEDPYDSGLALHLMEALSRAGNRAAALRAGRRHVRMLEEELGVAPSAEVQSMLTALQEDAAEAAIPGGPGPRGHDQDPRAVAVLPFEGLGGGEAAVFADGLHNDLLTRLSRVGGVTVISRTSVLRYRGGSADIPRIGRELGVGLVVEGSVQRVGDRLRVNVQLIDARTDTHRWAQAFDRTLTAANLFDIQGELAEKISEILRAHLSPAEREDARSWTPTGDLEAYRLHALGRARLDERTEGGMRKAVEYFRRALERDPGYALAWVGLADTLAGLVDYGYEPEAGTLPEAEAAARRALEVDAQLAEAHASLGLLASIRRRGPEAVGHLERAVELRPAYAEAHNWLSWTHNLLGRPEPARSSADRAVTLDPLSAEATSNLVLSLLHGGDERTALTEARRVCEIQPDWTSGPLLEGFALFRMGRMDEAASVLEGLSVEWTGVGAEATLGLIEAMAGREDRAREILSGFERAGEPFAAGLLHLALGDARRAADLLKRADVGRHWPTLAVRFLYPSVWEPLLEDGRYDALVKRVDRAWGVALGT